MIIGLYIFPHAAPKVRLQFQAKEKNGEKITKIVPEFSIGPR